MTRRDFEKLRHYGLPKDAAFPKVSFNNPEPRIGRIKRRKHGLPRNKAALRKIADEIAASIAAAKKGQ